MSISRYSFSSRNKNGGIATSKVSWRIFQAIENGTLQFSARTTKGNERLDHIAAKAYGSSDMWWIIAAASGIGWGLQVPPGTIVRIPKSMSAVMSLIR